MHYQHIASFIFAFYILIYKETYKHIKRLSLSSFKICFLYSRNIYTHIYLLYKIVVLKMHCRKVKLATFAIEIWNWDHYHYCMLCTVCREIYTLAWFKCSARIQQNTLPFYLFLLRIYFFMRMVQCCVYPFYTIFLSISLYHPKYKKYSSLVFFWRRWWFGEE